SYQTAPQNTADARVYYGSYQMPFSPSFNVVVNAIKSDSNVSTVGGTEVLGRGTVAGFRGNWTLPLNGGLYQYLTMGLDYKHFRNQTSLGEQSFETPVTYYPLNVGYSLLLRQGATTWQNSLSASLSSPRLGSTSEELSFNRDQARRQQFALHES